MNELIKRFEEYLKNAIALLNQINDSKLKFKIFNKIGILNTILKFIQLPEEQLSNAGFIFCDFKKLSEVLKESPFTLKEQTAIIFYIITKNLSYSKMNSTIIDIDFERLKKYEFIYTTYEEITNLIYSGKLNSYVFQTSSNKSEANKQNEIEKAISSCSVEYSHINRAHEMIKEHYFENENVTLNDIECIITAFVILGVDESIILEAKKLLIQELTPVSEDSKQIEEATHKFQKGISKLCATNILLYNNPKDSSIKDIYAASTIYSYFRYPESVRQSKTVLIDLSLLTQILKYSNLTDKELSILLFQIIKINISSDILTSETILNKDDTALENINNAETYKISGNLDAFPHLYSLFYRETYMSQKEKEEKVNGLLASNIDYNVIKKAHENIKNHYLDNKDSFTEEDIQIITDSFTNLNLAPEYLIKVQRYLWKELNRRKKQQENQLKENESMLGQKDSLKIPNLKPLINKKTYNTIYREISCFYNLDKQYIFVFVIYSI